MVNPDDKLNEIAVSLGKIEVILERNTIDLEEHMKRTELLERQVIKFNTVFWTLGTLFTLINVVLSIWAKLGGSQ